MDGEPASDFGGTAVLEGSDLAFDRLAELAGRFGTPLFVYDAAAMRAAAARLSAVLSPRFRLFYSLKANPHPAIVRLLVGEGLGAEVASAGELELALSCGASPRDIVFSGPAKTRSALEAAVHAGIQAIQVESADELAALQAVCERDGRRARVALRLNLGSGAGGGREGGWGGISPFGMDEAAVEAVAGSPRLYDRLDVIGLHSHQSSQALDGQKLAARFEAFARHAGALRSRFDIRFVNFGGGFGVPFYADEKPLDLRPVAEFFRRIARPDGPFGANIPEIAAESGRYLVGAAGWYVTRVVAVKRSSGVRFASLDGGIHHALGLSGTMRFLRRPMRVLAGDVGADAEPTELAGPLCTPIDRLAGVVPLPRGLAPGDVLAFAHCGAYAKQASPLNFLGHDWPAEVLVDGAAETVIARRVGFAEILCLQEPEGAPA